MLPVLAHGMLLVTLILGARPAPHGRNPPVRVDPVTGEKRVWPTAKTVIDLYPGPDSHFASSSVKLSWHAAERAERYRVQVATDGAFQSVTLDRTGSGLDVTASGLRPGHYFWRVASLDHWGTPAEWSTVNDFEIRPANALGEAKLNWRPSTSIGVKYQVEVARDAKFSGVVATGRTENAFFTPQPLPHGRYYWRVTTFDGDGKKLEVSATKTFDVAEGGIVTYQGG
ncbi:MAG TPA: hypothetical protein VMV18_05055 [bacterium]|nr:hypothetical protein [bacterium]